VNASVTQPSTGAATAPVTKLGLFAYALALVAIVADQVSKAWVLHGVHLVEGAPVTVLPIFRLSLVWNRGFSFGLLSESSLARWGLFAFSVAVAIGLAIWARRIARWLPALALGLIMGGAVGNAIDRVRLGAVVDFLDFTRMGFPWVFNVADSAITVGVVLLLLDSVLTRPKVETH
jgi:signal peptidase II